MTPRPRYKTDSDIRNLNEAVCNRVGDGYSLREETIGALLDTIKQLQYERDKALGNLDPSEVQPWA